VQQPPAPGTKQNLWNRLRESQDLERRLAIALPLSLFVLIPLVLWLGPYSWVTLSVVSLLATVLALAAVLWLEKIFRAMVSNSLVVGTFHAIVVFITAVPARLTVSAALKLPAQDFELAVALMTGALYLPMWVLIASLILLSVASVLVLYASIVAMLRVYLLTGPVQFFVDASRWREGYERWLVAVRAHAQRYGLRALEAFTLALALSVMSAAVIGYACKQSAIVRWVAYLADFQGMDRYPCMADVVHSKDGRVRLHENGVVSVARPKGFDVDIEVYTLDVNDCKLNRR